ncbi:MAG: hypothetical protein ACTHVY_08365 [Brevibacterium yomogidense]
MNLGIILFIVMAVGSLVVFGLAIALVLMLIRRSRPGRAAVPAHVDALPGSVGSAVVTVVPRSPGLRTEEGDLRRVSVVIDVDGPRGRGQITDQPVKPEYLPWALRRRMFSLSPFRYGDLQLNLEGEDVRNRAADQARAGGFRFPIDPPLPVSVVHPGGDGARPVWRIEGR